MDALATPSEASLVIPEGGIWVLHDHEPWREISKEIDETWGRRRRSRQQRAGPSGQATCSADDERKQRWPELRRTVS